MRAMSQMHAKAKHPQRSGKQFGRPGPLMPMARHPVHPAVPPQFQPTLKARLGFRKIDSRHSGLLEAEFPCQRRKSGGYP